MEDTYTHGHQEAVLRSHRWRTVENSAGYLLPHLAPGMNVLDVGCGPGTITAGLAARVAPGRVTGVDREPGVVDQARAAFGSTAEFRAADAYRLPFPDGAFDVVHAHQVLQHLTDPVAALGEMRRVLKPGGRLAVRDADYGAFVWYPGDPRLDRWREIYTAVCSRNHADANAGRSLPAWVGAAGFEGVEVSSSTWTFADADSRTWWAGTWAERTVASSFAGQALDYGLSSRDELEVVAAGWRQWGLEPSALFVVVHLEAMGTH
jgi:SAM-dependent methyltransferase